MPRIKKQHYVPQSYLSRFADEGSLYVFDKALNKVFPSNIRDIANDKYFYDVPEIDAQVGEDQAIEKFFRPFETAAAIAISNILNSLEKNRFCRIHPEQRIDISIYLALQSLRTIESRETMLQISETLYKESFLAYLDAKRPDIKLSRHEFDVCIDKNKHSAHHALTILDGDLRDELATIIHDHYWVILKNETSQFFYTSDNPLVKYGHLNHPVFTLSGFKSPGIEISFPITTQYILVIGEKTAFPFLKKHDGKLQYIKDIENVTYYNHLQVKYSYRQIFSKNKDFNLAISMLKETPELGEYDYQRIGVKTY